MANFYTWNEDQSIDRSTILKFLNAVQTRAGQGHLPMKLKDFNLAVNVIRGMLDLKPSQVEGRE